MTMSLRSRGFNPQIVALLCAFLLLVLTLQVGASSMGAGLDPTVVLRVVPHNAQALARRAEAEEQATPINGSTDAAAMLAMRALRTDPTQVPALRTIGKIAVRHGDLARAQRLFRYTERLTRRDLLTELWYIETGVAAGDVAGALDHYDLALRTSSQAGTLLFPILARASAEPAIAGGLSKLLARQPPWAAGFYQTLVGTDVSPDTIAAFLSRPDVDAPSGVIDGAIRNLAAVDRIDLSWRLYRKHSAPPLVRNGGFEHEDRAVPFEWQYAAGDVVAEREVSAGQGSVAFRADDGVTGEVMRQLLVLSPGRYTISAAQTLEHPDRTHLAWNVSCAGGRAPLARLPVSSAASPFAIPTDGCAAQWLSLRLEDAGEGAVTGRIAKVRLTATRP